MSADVPADIGVSLRRIRRYRWLANNGLLYLFGAGLISSILEYLFQQPIFMLFIFVWPVLMLLAVTGLALLVAFKLGLIRCPSCARAFDRSPIPYVAMTCRECGFDLGTRS